MEAITQRERDIWRAAITLANNICVKRSDDCNADYGSLDRVHEAADCAGVISSWVSPTDERLVEMFREAAVATSLQNMPTCTNSQTVVWRNIESDGQPPCNGEDWFLGANSQGAMCCFNFLDDTGMCWYCGPEDNAQLMDGLLWWAKVDAPVVTPNA